MRLISLWGPVFLVMALIFFSSSVSDPGAPPGGLSDKSAHVLAYAALGAAFVRALAGGSARRATGGCVIAAAALATVYGITDEVHQGFVPDRTPDAVDLLADAVGGLAGAFCMAVAYRVAGRRLQR